MSGAIRKKPKRAPLRDLQNFAAVSSTTIVRKHTPLNTATTTRPKLHAVKSDAKLPTKQNIHADVQEAIKNIDAGDAADVSLASVYVNDIFDYLFELEIRHSIRQKHLDGQLAVTAQMRAKLIDWISEVNQEFGLIEETFQMTVTIIDRYLQTVKNTKKSRLQLVGATALFLAAKFEEQCAPSIENLVFVGDDSYDAKEIYQMEIQIFKALDFNLACALPIQFLRRYAKIIDALQYHYTLAKYFLELSAMVYDLVAYKPSRIAATSLFLALHFRTDKKDLATGLNDHLWPPMLACYSRYPARHLRFAARKIANFAQNIVSSELTATYEKYASRKFDKVSLRLEAYGSLMDSIVRSTQS